MLTQPPKPQLLLLNLQALLPGQFLGQAAPRHGGCTSLLSQARAVDAAAGQWAGIVSMRPCTCPTAGAFAAVLVKLRPTGAAALGRHGFVGGFVGLWICGWTDGRAGG